MNSGARSMWSQTKVRKLSVSECLRLIVRAEFADGEIVSRGIRLLAIFCLALLSFGGQTNQTSPSDEAARGYIRAALEARSNGDFDAEAGAWRGAYIEAVTQKNPDGAFLALSSLDVLFKDNERPLERLAILRSGVD